jgi:hypothetical protein
LNRNYTVHEALRILRDHHITGSLQMVVRWIREGKLVGTRSENRKEGYLIDEDDLYEFITDRAPGLVQILKVHEEYLDNIVFDVTSPPPLMGKMKPKVQVESIKYNETQEEILNLNKKLIQIETDLLEKVDQLKSHQELIERNSSEGILELKQLIEQMNKKTTKPKKLDDGKQEDFFPNDEIKGDNVLSSQYLSLHYFLEEAGKYVPPEKKEDTSTKELLKDLHQYLLKNGRLKKIFFTPQMRKRKHAEVDFKNLLVKKVPEYLDDNPNKTIQSNEKGSDIADQSDKLAFKEQNPFTKHFNKQPSKF